MWYKYMLEYYLAIKRLKSFILPQNVFIGDQTLGGSGNGSCD